MKRHTIPIGGDNQCHYVWVVPIPLGPSGQCPNTKLNELEDLLEFREVVVSTLLPKTTRTEAGIGTSTPQVALDVSGGIRPGNYATASRPTCSSSILGTFIFDTTENRPYVCTSGGVWKPLDSDYDKDGITDSIDSDDNNSSDSTALSSDVLSGKTFYSGGQARTGEHMNGTSLRSRFSRPKSCNDSKCSVSLKSQSRAPSW